MPEGNMNQDELRLLAEQKEQEWRQLQNMRTSTLEATLKDKEKEIENLKGKFYKLKEDFKYNLKLLNERHAELDNYDKLVSELRLALSTRDAEISEIKIKLDEYRTSSGRETASREDMARHYQQRLREKQAELDHYRAAKDEDVAAERENLESSKRQLERRILILEEELTAQKHELTTGFEEALRTREHEFRVRADEMNSDVLAHDLQVKLLHKELEVAKSYAEKSNAFASQSDSHQREVEKALKKAEWELHDVTAMRDARITELKDKVERAEKEIKRMQEDFARRYSEVDRTVREKEACISKLKEAGTQFESEQATQMRDLESRYEDAQLKLKHMEWDMTDMAKDKDGVIERLHGELNDVKHKFNNYLSESHKDETAKDIEIQKLRESESKLKEDLTQRKIDIERYKKELVASVDRESDLQRAKAQADLDWQQRYEELERQQYERSEDLVKGLTRARDDTQAECTAKDKELKHQVELIKVLRVEREQAIHTLKQHGLPLDRSIKTTTFAKTEEESSTMLELRTQNENLLAVIREMRNEMETLGQELPPQPPTTPAPPTPAPPTPRPQTPKTSNANNYLVANEYVKNLEKEVQTLKAKLRKLEHDSKHKITAATLEATEKEAVASGSENPIVKSHVEALNNTIGQLRTEKMELIAQLRKQQTRISYMDVELSNVAKQPIQKQATIEQLQYELASQQRRHQVEVAGLKGRVADLELQLAETRKEADEYYKATIERNLETTALGNELSKMKIELGQKRPTVNFGAQELVIQQLQSEIDRMTKLHRQDPSLDIHLLSGDARGGSDAKRWADNTAARDLREKLKQAVKHISVLAREKKQLIEMGNRLRAQLYKAGFNTDEPVTGTGHHVAPVTYVPPGRGGDAGGVTFHHHLHEAPEAEYGGTNTTNASQLLMNTQSSAVSSGSGGVAGLSEKMKNKLIQLEKLQYELTKQKLSHEQQRAGHEQPPLVSTGELDLSASSGSVSLGPIGNNTDEEEEEEETEEFRPPSILKKRDPPVKLSPVPEHTIPQARPKTAPTDSFPRPGSAMSDTFRPTTAQSGRGEGGVLYSMSSMGMSSIGGESLADIWKMLDDEGASPRPFTPLTSGDGPFRGLQYPGDAYDRPSSSHSLTVRGSRSHVQPRPHGAPDVNQTQTRPHSTSTSQQAKKKPGKKGGPKPKIRNYNLKDDS